MGFGLFDEDESSKGMTSLIESALERVSKGIPAAVQLAGVEKPKIAESELKSIFTAQKEVRCLFLE